MANRNTLHINKLKDFTSWLIDNGWEIQPNKGIHDQLRAIHPSRKLPLIIYKKDGAKEHLTVQSTDEKILRKFMFKR